MATVPLLANISDQSASQTAGASSQLVPTGTVFHFAGISAPGGWLACDGSAVSRTTYAALFAATAFQLTGTTNATTTISSTSINPLTAGVSAGMFVSGSGIPAGATVASVTSTTIVLSAAATTSVVGNSIVVSPFGIGDGTTTFNVPDYRGRFARFNDAMFGGTAAGRDTGRGFGTAQAGATKTPTVAFTTASQTVTGTISETSALSNTNNIISSTDVQSNKANNTYGATGFNSIGSVTASSATLSHSHTISHALTAPASTVNGGGDAETRPINLSVYAIIKI